MPIGMCCLNGFGVATAFAFERRLKVTQLRFFFLYASTVPAALRGDMSPFFTVFTMVA
jgi:hypothetical protein